MGIGGIELESFFEGIFRTNQVAYAVLGGTLSTPAFCPVGLDLCGLVCIFEGCLVVFEGSVCTGAVGVEDVVCRV